MLALRAKSGFAYLFGLVLIAGMQLGVAHAADILSNPTHNYEIPYPYEFTADLSGWPDIVVFGIGETGRLIVEPVNLPESDEPVMDDDLIAFIFNALKSNFDELYIASEDRIYTATGLEGYQWNFEAYVEDTPIAGFARVLFGTTYILALYYDDSSEYGYQLPDVLASVDGITIDHLIAGMGDNAPDTSNNTELDYIQPLTQRYRNDDFGYRCLNPSMLEPSEYSGTEWIVFSTSTGEIAIRYLDFYRNSGKSSGEITDELLYEILVSFERYTVTSETEDYTDDNRPVSVLELDASFNGEPWKGSFVSFFSDRDEPFLMSFLAPEEEYVKHADSFISMWGSFSFTSD